MEKGKYQGVYQSYNEKVKCFEKTNFTLVITDSDGPHFKGWVEDDFLTGGMPGRGNIYGINIGKRISFVKHMPYLGFVIKNKETENYELKIDKTRKHPPIYYKGKEIEKSSGLNRYCGGWNFKYRVATRLFIWLKGIKVGGTWEMIKEPEIVIS